MLQFKPLPFQIRDTFRPDTDDYERIRSTRERWGWFLERMTIVLLSFVNFVKRYRDGIGDEMMFKQCKGMIDVIILIYSRFSIELDWFSSTHILSRDNDFYLVNSFLIF